jgi:hypothetical protein
MTLNQNETEKQPVEADAALLQRLSANVASAAIKIG